MLRTLLLVAAVQLAGCYGHYSPESCKAKYLKRHGLLHLKKPSEPAYHKCMARYYQRREELARNRAYCEDHIECER